MTRFGANGPLSIRHRLIAAGCLAVTACLPWSWSTARPVYRAIAVVDITQSMNVTDARLGTTPVSRLQLVKAGLRNVLQQWPCGSTLGLSVFTERSANLLFEPIEVCSGYDALNAAIEHLDWRMAWAADSRIAAGLNDVLTTHAGHAKGLAFITDGQEAPPLNPRYRTRLDWAKGKLDGVIVGVGELTPSPIPKFDEAGRFRAYVGEDEVPQRSTFGLSELAPEQIEGYHARNAPFGNAPAGGSEHLSALREPYLQTLAEEAGLGYRRAVSPDDLAAALTRSAYAEPATVALDLRWIPALLSLLLLLSAYVQPRPVIPGRATSRRLTRFLPVKTEDIS